MIDALTAPPLPRNERALEYAEGSVERGSLVRELDRMAAAGPVEIRATIGGRPRTPGGSRFEVTMPSDHHHVLATSGHSSIGDTEAAIAAAARAAPDWAGLGIDERAAIFLRAAELLSGPWRDRLNAATMLGQGKTVQQAEIDAACELIDFLRFNVAFARQIYAEQPISSHGSWNRVDHRPLEGFVYAVTPFNFTAIAGNLPTSAALMGNVVLWKPSPTQTLAADLTMKLLEAAGLPPGVINLLPGDGLDVSTVALAHPSLAGIHFTGSTATFQHLWRRVGSGIERYRTYPRLVGETGGKDFVLAHPSADPRALVTALVRGSFEYSGQKCSAASRAYLPRSLWEVVKEDVCQQVAALRVGDVRDLTSFTSALIDEKALLRHRAAIERAEHATSAQVLVGGESDDDVGWFARPTVLQVSDPFDEAMTTEYFSPILAVHVYADEEWTRVLDLVDATGPYGLTGAVFATDRQAVLHASRKLRHAAGNFYINDKPTGAVVGQQPFGGGRASGTNDKAGSVWNLARWVSPRALKETFVPATESSYPHMR